MPFEIPSNWEWVTFSDISEVVRGGSPRPAGSEEFYNGTIPFLKVADLTKDDNVYVNSAEYTIKEAGLKKTRFVKAGTLLLTNSGATLGVPKITTFDTSFNDGIAAFLNLDENIKLYSYWFLKSQTYNLRAINQGAGQPNLNTDLIQNFYIPIPPQTEQLRIVKTINQLFLLIDAIEKNGQGLLAAVTILKSKIIERTIRGKLVSQDLNDEPASELLMRIVPHTVPCDTSHYENIPESWCMVKLGDIYNHTTGKALKKSNTDGVLRKYITTSNLYWNSFDLTVVRSMYFTNEELEKCTAHKGDLLLCNGGDVGRAAIWNYDEDICIQNHISRLRPKYENTVDNLFYYYILMYLKQNGLLNGKGVAITSLSAADLLSIHVPLPPINEQIKIVQKIQEIENILQAISAEL